MAFAQFMATGQGRASVRMGSPVIDGDHVANAVSTPAVRRRRGLGVSAGLRAQCIRSLRDHQPVVSCSASAWGRITPLPTT